MPSRMLLEGACRSACLSDPVTVPTHDIAADGGLGWRQLIKRRREGVRRWPEGAGQLCEGGDGGEAVRQVRGDVLAGGCGRNAAISVREPELGALRGGLQAVCDNEVAIARSSRRSS